MSPTNTFTYPQKGEDQKKKKLSSSRTHEIHRKNDLPLQIALAVWLLLPLNSELHLTDQKMDWWSFQSMVPIHHRLSLLLGGSESVSEATGFVFLTGISWLCFPSYVVIKALGSSDALSTCLRTLHLRLVHL